MECRYLFSLFFMVSGCSFLLPVQIAEALTITDNFNGPTTANKWLQPTSGDGTVNAVCLTAGDATSLIPACPRLNDTEGNGALRLTDAVNNQHGAIVSDFTFPTNQGVEVTFTTYTYGGSGADGIAFFLADGTKDASIGGTGGSLGYSCSNVNSGYNGVKGGYIGLGIDEWGNFMNRGDNTATGFDKSGNPQGDGYQTIPGRIGLRGAGSVTGDNQPTVNKMCKYGTADGSPAGTPIYDYPALAATILPSTKPINNQTDKCSNNKTNCSRGIATPISYKLKITSDGYLSLWWSYKGGAYQALLSDQNITKSNGPLPASFRFGFTGSTGGFNNIHEITCFQASPSVATNDSASISLPTAQFNTGAQVYLASYFAANWWGQLTSRNLLYDTKTGDISVNKTANWDASCVLTGGNCSSTGATGMTPQDWDSTQAHKAPDTSRQIVTWDGKKGVAFKWSDLNTAQQTALNAVAADRYDNAGKHGEERLNYLRGKRADEVNSDGSGLFRHRTGILGDIVNSSPTWVGPPSAPFPSSSYSIQSIWSDMLYPTETMKENAATADSYDKFQTTYGSRTNLVYVGANDGFLHAFRSGYYDSKGNYVGDSKSIPNDGKELFAYMPSGILSSIHNSSSTGVDFSSPLYGHNYYLDEVPGTGDLFYNNKWHTWLVGGLGFGGQLIYALDITNPTDLVENKASTIVIGEWAFDGSESSVWNRLGKTYGTPLIRRLHDGNWAIIFGNGWCVSSDATCSASSDGHAGVYILPINSKDGSIGTPIFLDTGVGSTTSPNGIASITSADLDGDHITDYLYAGDLAGNIWRFDLTSKSSSDWAASSKALFKTETGQPITTQLTVSSSKSSSATNPRVVINFGTGQQLPQKIDSASVYATGTQDLYGIWDWDMGDWNSKSATKYAALTAASSPAAPDAASLPITKKSLAQQTATTKDNKRSLSNNVVCWRDLKTCDGGVGNDKYGWYLDLGSTTVSSTKVYEQVIYSPIVVDGAFIVNTTFPPTNSPLTCSSTTATGWTIPLDPATGVGLPGFFSGNSADTIGYASNLNATGTPSVVNVYGQPVLITQTSSGDPAITKIYPKATGTRINWVQLR